MISPLRRTQQAKQNFHMTSTTERLTAAILADRARPTTQHNIVPCFVCGYTFVYKGRRDDLNGHFCSMRCQEWYDAGNAPISDQRIVYRYRDARPMKSGSKGFYIACAHCRKEFESLGLRCCSAECERTHRERRDNFAVMAEVGIETSRKCHCAAPGCSVIIPTWKNGRRVSSKVAFCSPKCRQRAHRAAA
jgi:hypothetical protein